MPATRVAGLAALGILVAASLPFCALEAHEQPDAPTAAYAEASRHFSVMLELQGEGYVAARNTVVDMGAPAIPFLREKIKNQDWHVRILAEVALDRMAYPDRYRRFQEALERRVQWAMRSRPGLWTVLRSPMPTDGKGARRAKPAAPFDETSPALFLIEVTTKRAVPRPSVALGVRGKTPPVQAVMRDDRRSREYGLPVSCYAALHLGALDDARGWDALIETLAFADEPRLRACAAIALARTTAPQAVQHLLAALDDGDSAVRGIAAGALGSTGDRRGLGALIRTLEQDSDGSVRQAAARALGCIGGDRAVKALVRALETDPNRWVRLEAVDMLGHLEGDLAIKALLGAVRDGHEQLAVPAALHLSRIGGHSAVDPLIAITRQGNKWARKAAACALGRLKATRAVEPLIRLLEDPVWDVRAAAIAALIELGDARGVQPLLGLLDHADPDTRGRAAYALGKMGDTAALEPLIRLLSDKQRQVRQAAIEALARIDDQRAVQPLIEIVATGDEWDCFAAARILGNIGDKRAVGPLINLLQHPSSRVRWRAADALGKIGDKAAVGPLIALLDDPTPSVRSAAGEALGRMRDQRAVQPLIRRLQEESQDSTRAAVRAALVALTGQNFRDEVGRWRQWWESEGKRVEQQPDAR